MAAARASGGASDGPRSLATVQAMPPRGREALPEGRALPDGQVRRRAAHLPAGRPRSRPPEAVRVPPPAAREAEGPPLLRRPREAVRQLLRQGEPPTGRHRREPAPSARVAARQHACATRLRGIAAPGAPADPPRTLDGQRPSRERAVVPGE